MWTLRFAFFDPSSQTVLAGELIARRTHSWFLDVLEADVTLQI